jgi:hypothetical protein
MAYLKNNECIFLLLLTFFGLSNNRPFGKRNRPGFPTDMEFVGNFSARAQATAAISSMTVKLPGVPEPSHLISRLTDFAIMRYKPRDTILIVVSQPATLTISPQHLVSQTALIYVT